MIIESGGSGVSDGLCGVVGDGGGRIYSMGRLVGSWLD